jgi:hypothetical protein
MTTILDTLIKNQINDINKNKLQLNDLKRIANNLDKDIFTNECSIWQGSIIKKNDTTYLSFYLNYRKICLNRVLYNNFVQELKPNEYLKCICNNKGKCCTLAHYIIAKNKKNIIIPVINNSITINNSNNKVEQSTTLKTSNELTKLGIIDNNRLKLFF